jgi:hypothetical protein
MDWSNERYVRLYTRDTTNWTVLSWQARSLWCLLMRKLDRAGVLEMGRHGPRGLAVVVGMPLDVVQPALQELLEDGCIVLCGTALVAPNFMDAQDAPQSDAQRKRESRARYRDLALHGRSVAAVCKTSPDGHESGHRRDETRPGGHESRPDVTSGHVESQAVTLDRTVPYQTGLCAPKPAAKRRPLPPDWQPNAAHAKIAAENGRDLHREAANLRDWAAANNERKADWDAAFRNWLRKEFKTNGTTRPSGGPDPLPPGFQRW